MSWSRSEWRHEVIAGEVKRRVVECLLQGKGVRMHDLASELRMASSSLRRHLSREGTSFRAIKHAIRHELATYYLTRTSRRDADISDALGFAEASSFYRAFRKWTGEAPGQFKRRQDPANSRAGLMSL